MMNLLPLPNPPVLKLTGHQSRSACRIANALELSSSPIADLRPLTSAQHSRSRGFTLLELLMVMGIMAIALAALVPAVTSLSKSGGRRAARNTLLGGIEQARGEAIKSAQATYVVFPTFTSGTQSTLDRYNYRSYAIFEDDAANPGNVKQLTDWKTFSTGVALRAFRPGLSGQFARPWGIQPGRPQPQQ